MAITNPFAGFWIVNTTTGEIKHVAWYWWTIDYSLQGVWLPFDSKAQAEKYAKAHPVNKHDPLTGIAGGIIDANPGQAAGGVSQGVKDVTGIDIPQFLSALKNANTWLRIAEVAVGLVLLAVGVAQLTQAVPIATKIAKAVK